MVEVTVLYIILGSIFDLTLYCCVDWHRSSLLWADIGTAQIRKKQLLSVAPKMPLWFRLTGLWCCNSLSF